MARRVFFSFHYDEVWRVNEIRNVHNIVGTAAAGFQDASLWESSKLKGDRAIEKLIDEGLQNTSVTVVCVTEYTATRKYIDYEINKSLDRGNGLVAVKIHNLKDSNRNVGSPGVVPAKIEKAGFKVYTYTNMKELAAWIEEAAKIAGR